jgi:ATP-dependent Lon protease
VRSHTPTLEIPADFLEKTDVHLHVPAGATPKDGPSAGVAMLVAMSSLLTGRRVRHDTAMTGEITLRGAVLPIGGLTEKLVAARRAGVRTVLLPRANEKDLSEVPEEVRADLAFVSVETMDQVLEHALDRNPQEPLTVVSASVPPPDEAPGRYAH